MKQILMPTKNLEMDSRKENSFIDEEFVKGCLLPMVNIICPKTKSSFVSISLSARTIP